MSAQSYQSMHRASPVIDGHNDVLGRVLRGGDITVRSKKGHSDIPRLREGSVDAQIFAVWVPTRHKGAAAWRYTLEAIDSMKAMVDRMPDMLLLATGHDDIDRAIREDKLAVILSLEGGRSIEGKRERILELHRRGLRAFGLTWNNSHEWATSSKDEHEGRVSGGLSEKGKDFVRLMDSLGILVDVSHLGERAFHDVAAISTQPLFASHSSCAALRTHHRNLSDEQLRMIAGSDGVAMINFFPVFLVSNLTKQRIAAMRAFERRMQALKKEHPDRGENYLQAYDALVAEAMAAGLCTIENVVAHIDHAVRVAGPAHVGLGSDFDGINLTPVGLNDVTDLPMLTRALMHKGFTEQQIYGILGGNVLRIWRQRIDR
ncbi:MAG: dipeptidase [Bacteroidetes bacterium]|nr:dipeptidase [Bacteroidota bacterium]